MSPCRASFVDSEGIELMHLLLKGKKSSRYGAIKTTDFATTRCVISPHTIRSLTVLYCCVCFGSVISQGAFSSQRSGISAGRMCASSYAVCIALLSAVHGRGSLVHLKAPSL